MVKLLRKNKKVFTLVEMLISIVIMVIVSAIIYLFFIVGMESWQIGSGRIDLHSDVRIALDAMIDELKNTTRNHSTRGITILVPPGNTKIIFYLPEKDVDGNVIIGQDGEIKWPADDADYIEYKYVAEDKQLVREDLQVREGGASARILANDVSSIEFIDASIDGALFLDEVNVVLGLQKTTAKGRDLSFLTRATVKLRN